MVSLDEILALIIFVVETVFDAGVLWLLVTGWSLPMIMALAALAYKNSGFGYRIAALVLAGIGIINGYFASQYFNYQAVSELYLALLPAVVFGAGPVMWLGLKFYINPLFEFKNEYFIHFVPGVSVSVLLSCYLLLARFGEWAWAFEINSSTCVLAGYLYSTSYVVFVAKDYWHLLFDASAPSTAQATRKTFLISVGLMIALLAVSAGGVLIVDIFSPLFPVILMTVLHLTFVVVCVRSPKMIKMVFEAIETAPHRRTLLSDFLRDDIAKKLESLMLERKRYQDSDISLPILAEEVGVSTHQLSEYLNFDVGSSFARFINGYRVLEIKAQLVEKPSLPVLDIALNAGFNSKSAFNAAFSDIAGTTPSAWRNLNKSKA